MAARKGLNRAAIGAEWRSDSTHVGKCLTISALRIGHVVGRRSGGVGACALYISCSVCLVMTLNAYPIFGEFRSFA